MAMELEKELRKASKGKMPKDIRASLAEKTVAKLDFNNSFQMHRSLKSYAGDLVYDFFLKSRFAR